MPIEWAVETSGKEDGLFSPFLRKPFAQAIRDGVIPASLIQAGLDRQGVRHQ